MLHPHSVSGINETDNNGLHAATTEKNVESDQSNGIVRGRRVNIYLYFPVRHTRCARAPGTGTSFLVCFFACLRHFHLFEAFLRSIFGEPVFGITTLVPAHPVRDESGVLADNHRCETLTFLVDNRIVSSPFHFFRVEIFRFLFLITDATLVFASSRRTFHFIRIYTPPSTT